MAKTSLKLVAVGGARLRHPRPIHTHYQGSDRYATSTTVQRAVLAAVRRVVRGDYYKAEVLDERGRLAASVTSATFGFVITEHRKGALK